VITLVPVSGVGRTLRAEGNGSEATPAQPLALFSFYTSQTAPAPFSAPTLSGLMVWMAWERRRGGRNRLRKSVVKSVVK
jgi:hypothetical protein